jgi:DNA polymerase III subunit epsilon
MRQIVLDTETTGLEVALGHRVIEVAGVEIVNRRLTGRHFHKYLNPQRDVEQGALQVHGLTLEFLQDKPLFRDVVAELIEFIDGAELIIHNAAFDISFLDSELALAALKPVSAYCHTVTDTLRMARDLHPGKRNSLDALCERYQIYLSMTRGQETLMIAVGQPERMSADIDFGGALIDLIVVVASEEELAAHQQQLEDIDKAAKGACVWKRLEALSQGLAA